MLTLLAMTAALLAQPPAAASTPEGLEALNRASESACLRAAALDDARISPPTRFSDDSLIEVRIVDGRVVRAGTAGERTTLLCLYHRGTGRAETRVFDPNPELAYSREVRDVWWHAVQIAGRPVIGTEVVTMNLGSDGRIAGRSGCNLYSALFRLSNETLEVVWPMTGTRQSCAPAVMDQEVRFREIVLQARSVRVQPDGSLLLSDSEGRTVRFVRAEGRMRPGSQEAEAPPPRQPVL
jgi:heat shock protein HslJ